MIRIVVPLFAVACLASDDSDDFDDSKPTDLDGGPWADTASVEDSGEDFEPAIVPSGSDPCRDPVPGMVEEVIDGDTLKVATGRGVERVRLIGIDTPEVDHSGPDDECFGEEAKAFVDALLNGEQIWMGFDAECEDHFGRTLAYVQTLEQEEEGFLQRILLSGGWAETLAISPNTSFAGTFASDEAAARGADAGMWGACP